MPDALARLRRLARPMVWLATLAMVFIPVFWCISVVSGEYDLVRLSSDLGIDLPADAPSANLIAVHLSSAVGIALLMVVLWHMRRLFQLFARGDVLGPNAAKTIRRIGVWLLVTAIYGVLNHTFAVLALTMTNPAGERSLAIALSSHQVFLMLSAGLLVAIGWAMSEAARIADENRGFV